MSRQNINVSFPDEETTLYKELTLESSLSYVPVSVLIRNYVKEGMKSKNRKQLTTAWTNDMTTNIIYEETLNLKTGVACKLNKLKPDKRHRDELEKLFYFMNQEHIKALMQSLGSYDKREYVFKKNKWYIKFWFCDKKTLLLLSTHSCIVKTLGE